MTAPVDVTFGANDFGLKAHQAAEAHLAACWTAHFDEEEGQVVEWPETAGPFCGCDTCIVREVLHAAYPILREGILAEQALDGWLQARDEASQ